MLVPSQGPTNPLHSVPLKKEVEPRKRANFADVVDSHLTQDGKVPLGKRVWLLLFHFESSMETEYLHFSQLPDTLVHAFLALVMGLAFGFV